MKAQGRPESLPCRPQCWTSAEHPWDDVKWTARVTGRGDTEKCRYGNQHYDYIDRAGEKDAR